jgi:hypothetical protein
MIDLLGFRAGGALRGKSTMAPEVTVDNLTERRRIDPVAGSVV